MMWMANVDTVTIVAAMIWMSLSLHHDRNAYNLNFQRKWSHSCPNRPSGVPRCPTAPMGKVRGAQGHDSKASITTTTASISNHNRWYDGVRSETVPDRLPAAPIIPVAET